MQVGDPEEEIEKVAQAGIRGMVGALGRETVSPHVMIEAALHVLAAWVASSQTHSPTAERAEEVDELLEILPSYIEYHRTAGWLPGRFDLRSRDCAAMFEKTERQVDSLTRTRRPGRGGEMLREFATMEKGSG